MSLVAAFTVIALCGVVFACAIIVRQTGDPVNRFGMFAGGIMILLHVFATSLDPPTGENGLYHHPAELVLALTALGVLIALTLRIRRYRRLGQIIDPMADASYQLPGLLNSLPVQAAFLTPDLRYGFVNDAYCTALGRPRADVLGRHLSEIVPPDALGEVKANLEKALGGQQVNWLFDFTRPVLQRNEGAAVYQPLSDRGRVAGVLVMVMDRSAPLDAARQAEISETKHALAAEVAGVGYLEWDRAGELVDVSSEVEALLDHDAQTLRRMWREGRGFVDPRSRAVIAQNLNRADRRPRDVIENLHFRAADGRQIELRTGIRRLQDGDDTRLLAAIQDVTDQQRLLDDLVESETRFRDFTESATDWVWEMDADLRFTLLSGGGRYSADDNPFFRLGQPLSEARIARDLGDYAQLLERLAAQEPFRDLRLVLPLEAGRDRQVDVSGKPFYASDGSLAGYRGTCFDMTEIVAAETAGESAREALALAFENISTLVALFDGEDRLVYCNEQYRASFEPMEGGDIIGRHFDELLDHFVETGRLKAGAEARIRWTEKRRNRREAPARFTRVQSWDGRWLEVTDYPVPAGGLLTIAADITERVAREERLHHHETALQRLNRRETLGQMTASIAHELNQPLAAIQNYAAGCVLRAQNDQLKRDDMIAVLHNMQEQSERASAILRSMSNYLQSDEAEREVVPFDEILRAVRHLIQPESAATGVAVLVDDRCDGVPLHCTRIEIEQLLINLIKNGIEACLEAGRPDAEVRVTAHCTDCDILIDVEDDGPGFADGMPVERAFTAFRSTKDKGLGVGLAICETIVKAHDGVITVTKSDATGARMTVKLPLAGQE